jgi:hypothetical protein
MIKVRTMGKSQTRLMDVIQAQRILEDIYNDPMGGLVIDARTQQAITQISQDTEEIIIIEQMLGGG